MKKKNLKIIFVILCVILVLELIIVICHDGFGRIRDWNDIEKVEIIKKFGEEELKICPDEWYDNQMPCACIDEVCSNCENNQYFVVDGERKELFEFDVNWVKENCDLEIQILY